MRAKKRAPPTYVKTLKAARGTGGSGLILTVVFDNGDTREAALSGMGHRPLDVASMLTMLAVNTLHHVGEEINPKDIFKNAIVCMEKAIAARDCVEVHRA